MQDLTIIGAGLCAQTLIDQLKGKGYSKGITLIDKDDFYFSRPELISSPGDISKRIELLSWAKERGAQFINDKVERVSLKRRKIYFKNSETLKFKKLIIATGLQSNKQELKGQHREGFFYLSGINPLRIKDLIKISKESTVDVSTFLGVKLAKSLSALGLEVRITSLSLDFLGCYKERIIDDLKQNNIIINLGTCIDEAVGESTIKAVKVKPLKVFSSQLLFIDSGFIGTSDFFEEEVDIADTFFSNFEDVYFLGDVSNNQANSDKYFINNYSDCRQQALVFAQYFLDGKRVEFIRKCISPEEEIQAIRDCFGNLDQANACDSISEYGSEEKATHCEAEDSVHKDQSASG